MPLSCFKHLVFDDGCDRCRHAQILSAINDLRSDIQIITNNQRKNQEKIMSAFDDLKTAFEAYRDDVKADVAALIAKVDELTAAIASGASAEAIASLTAEVNATKTDLDVTAATPVTVTPTP